MYIFNDSKKFKLVCVKYDNCIEFKVNRNGNVIEGILSKVSIITGLLFLHLTRPVNSPISQIPFGTRNSFSMFSTMISMCQLWLRPLVSLRIFSVRTISPTLMVISSCPLANISSGLKINVKSYPIR